MESTLNKPTLLINESPLQVLPTLATAIGLNEAIVLQQFYYWMNRSNNERDGKKWIYNSYKAWSKQFPFFSERTLRRTINNLEERGLLIVGNYNRSNFDKTKWYTIDIVKLQEIVEQGDVDDELTECPDASGHNDQPMWPDCPHRDDQSDQTNTNRLPEITTKNYIYTTTESWVTHAFNQLWELYPLKTGKKRAYKAFAKWIQEDPSHTTEYMKDRIEKYLIDLKIDIWKQPMGGATFFEGRFADEFKTEPEHRRGHTAKSYKKRKPVVQKETLPKWAKTRANNRQQNNDPKELYSGETINKMLAELRKKRAQA